MPKLTCKDCGEVIHDGLSEGDADGLTDGEGFPDERSDAGDGESGAGGGGKQPERKDAQEIEDEMEDEYSEKADELGEDGEEEAEEAGQDASDYYDAADNAGVAEPGFLMGTADPPPQGRWEECMSHAEKISRIFSDKLRQKRREKTHHEQRSGRFDSRKLIPADRGSARVFKRRDEGDELKYETYFVLDRSSSMRSDGQVEAEEAVATLMKALEDSGVRTELLEFQGHDVSVVKTKSQRLESEVGNVLRAESSGGTPIAKVMKLLEERITGTDGRPFVIVVTDAEIKGGTKKNYLETIQRMNCPVLGVTIGDDAKIEDEEAQRYYHYAVQADIGEPLHQKIADLARNVML